MNRARKDTKNSLLKALFSRARAVGIDSDELRDVIAPAVISKRLSEATPREVMRVLDHITTPLSPPLKGGNKRGVYPASRDGLIDELKDASRERWGQKYEKPLNAFINSHRKTATHYRFLPTGTLKQIKERIKELNAEEKPCHDRPN